MKGVFTSMKKNIDKLNKQKEETLKIISNLMDDGVIFLSTDGVLIDPEVKVGKGTVIYPGTILKGNTIIGENSTIGPNSLIQDSSLGNECVINASQVYQSKIEDDVAIGPFSHIRPNSSIKSGVRIGDFVEVKNSNIDEETHISHLTYIGDSDVGKKVNFGCGCVTVNYTGSSKHRCTIGNRAFIGCNTNLVAPVSVGDNAYTAAGSTITEDVPSETLAIARARQINKEGYAKDRYTK